MAIAGRDTESTPYVQHELSEIGVVGERGRERAEPAVVTPLRPRRIELLVPPLFLGGIVIALVAALVLIIPWGGDAARGQDDASAMLLIPPGFGERESPASPDGSAGATLLVETEPAGARVIVDDQLLQPGPSGELRVDAGYRWLTLELEGYQVLDTLVFAAAGAPTRVITRLQPVPGAAEPSAESASSPPPRSEATPPSRDQQPRQAEPAGTRRAPAARDVAPPSVVQTHLSVTATPSEAEILLDGVSWGRAPLHLADLEPGSYEIVARHPDFEAASRTVVLQAGQSRSVEFQLRPAASQEGRIAITVRPWGSIYVDGELKVANSDVRFMTCARPGMRRVRAVHPQLGASEVTVEVKPNELTSIVIDLVP